MIIRKTEIKNGQTYRPIKYMITRNACYKLLVRSFNEDKYADYFSLLWQISEQYKKYATDYDNHIVIAEKNHTIKMKDGKIAEMFERNRRDAAEYDENRKRDAAAFAQTLKQMRKESANIAERNRQENASTTC